MKTLEFIYQKTQIHFLINPTDENVMVNATEMAKLFNKKVEAFMRNENTKAFLNECIKSENSRFNLDNLIDSRQKSGTLMHRILALKFAAWLDPAFELWVFSKIEEITFGNLKQYRDAMLEEVTAKNNIESLKQNLIADPTLENVKAYFDNEAALNSAKAKKRKATTNQLNLFQEQKNQKL